MAEQEVHQRRQDTPRIEVIRLVGTSEKSVFEAIDKAVESSGVHGRNIHKIDVVSISAIPNPSAKHNPGYINGVQVVIDLTGQHP